jgi:hypothetical protein
MYSFRGYNPSLCKLYVPKESVERYKYSLEWNNFPFINAVEESEFGNETTKCEVPSITFTNGVLHFSSATPAAQYHHTIKDKDIANDVYSQNGEVALSAAYEIYAYATADGYTDSDIATATLYWLPTTVVNNINTTSTRVIITSCNKGIITISGLNAQENVTFYTVNGDQLGSATAVDNTAMYAVNTTGDVVIAKFGNSSIKIDTK